MLPMNAGCFRYPIHLMPDPEGGFVVTFPDFPEAVTRGDTAADAIEAAADCLDEAIAARILGRDALPPASPTTGHAVSPSIQIAAKASLYALMREEGLTIGAMARRLDVAETEARRLLDPHHATRINRLEAALKSFGKRLSVQLETA